MQEQKPNNIRQALNVSEGDIVRLIAPGGAGTSEFEPNYHSNTDEFRANNLISALLDDSKVVWCLRGGRGVSRVIPYLERHLPSTLNHKVFVGQSAVTVLHLYLQHKYGWQTIHGSNIDYIGGGLYDESDESRASLVALEDLILERKDSICLPLMRRIDDRPAVAQIESRMIGGNLELVETSIGTFWQVDAKGRILFFEDVGRDDWRIEMTLDHMTFAGVFDDVEAVVFADFTILWWNTFLKHLLSPCHSLCLDSMD